MSLAKPIRHINTGYPYISNIPVVSPIAGFLLRVYSVRLDNESGSTTDVGFFKGGSSADRQYFTFNGTVLTEVTKTLNLGSPVGLFAGSGTGFAIQATQQFQAVMVNVSTGSTGGTFTIKYWNGTAFVDVLQQVNLPTDFATGQQLILFSAGPDWVPGGNLAGLNQAKYSITFTATGQSGVGNINSAITAQMIQYAASVPTASAFESDFDVNYPLQFDAGETLIPYFGDANNNNKVIAFYSQEN